MANRTCSEDDCNGPVIARSLCGMHYARARKSGGPLPPTKSVQKRKCLIGGCPRDVRSNGYCKRHSENLRLFGNPIPRKERSLDELLREVGWTVTGSGCWEWDGSRNDAGYGLFTAAHLGLHEILAHRVAYEHFTGPIPDGMLVRHACDNPPCMNPDHLSVGTKQDNAQDMIDRGRHWAQKRTHCDNGHDLRLPGATRRSSWGNGITGNVCVECRRDRKRRYNERKRAS